MICASTCASRIQGRFWNWTVVQCVQSRDMTYFELNTAMGVVGFLVGPGLATGTLIVFPVNGPHNMVHILVGVAGIFVFRRRDRDYRGSMENYT